MAEFLFAKLEFPEIVGVRIIKSNPPEIAQRTEVRYKPTGKGIEAYWWHIHKPLPIIAIVQIMFLGIMPNDTRLWCQFRTYSIEVTKQEHLPLCPTYIEGGPEGAFKAPVGIQPYTKLYASFYQQLPR